MAWFPILFPQEMMLPPEYLPGGEFPRSTYDEILPTNIFSTSGSAEYLITRQLLTQSQTSYVPDPYKPALRAAYRDRDAIT